MLGEVAAKLVVLRERWMEALGGERDEAVDDRSVVRLGRHIRFDQLDESQDEFGDRGDVRVGERETGRTSNRRPDPGGGIRDPMIDEPAQRSALKDHVVRAADASSDYRDEE